MIQDAYRRVDGFLDLVRGVDSSRASSALPPNQAVWATNTTFRGGFVRNRPGWRRIALTFKGDGNREASVVQSVFETRRFQGAGVWRDPQGGNGHLLMQVYGQQFVIRWPGPRVEEITISGARRNRLRPQTWITQAEEFAVFQDGEGRPLIYNGSTLRQSDIEAREVPVGTVMEYAQGRLWVALPDGISFIASDLVYGPSGTPAFRYRDAVLKFTENQLIGAGGAFGVPSSAGRITAIRAVATPDTQLGDGPVQVFTENATYSLNPPFDRTEWQNLSSPIQIASLLGPGPTGQAAVVGINGDLWYRASDGVRSFRVGRRDYSTWVNTPMSAELLRVLAYDDRRWLAHASGVWFDNRLILTAAPLWVEGHGVVWQKLVVADFNAISGMLERASPIWEGEWAGPNVLQVLTCRVDGLERCFLLVLSADNTIQLWELTESETSDNGSRIVWTLETRSMGFQDGGWELKQLTTGDLWLDTVAPGQTLDVVTSFKSDQLSTWNNWHSFSIAGNAIACTPACPPACYAEDSYRTRKQLPEPGEGCETQDGKPVNRGYEFAAKLAFTGAGRIRRLRLVAHAVPEESNAGCTDDTPVSLAPPDVENPVVGPQTFDTNGLCCNQFAVAWSAYPATSWLIQLADAEAGTYTTYVTMAVAETSVILNNEFAGKWVRVVAVPSNVVVFSPRYMPPPLVPKPTAAVGNTVASPHSIVYDPVSNRENAVANSSAVYVKPAGRIEFTYNPAASVHGFVTVTHPDAGAVIRYSVDGSDVTVASPVISGDAVAASFGCVVKARAFKGDCQSPLTMLYVDKRFVAISSLTTHLNVASVTGGCSLTPEVEGSCPTEGDQLAKMGVLALAACGALVPGNHATRVYFGSWSSQTVLSPEGALSFAGSVSYNFLDFVTFNTASPPGFWAAVPAVYRNLDLQITATAVSFVPPITAFNPLGAPVVYNSYTANIGDASTVQANVDAAVDALLPIIYREPCSPTSPHTLQLDVTRADILFTVEKDFP